MLENLIEDFAHSLGSWAYLFVAVMAIAETAKFRLDRLKRRVF